MTTKSFLFLCSCKFQEKKESMITSLIFTRQIFLQTIFACKNTRTLNPITKIRNGHIAKTEKDDWQIINHPLRYWAYKIILPNLLPLAIDDNTSTFWVLTKVEIVGYSFDATIYWRCDNLTFWRRQTVPIIWQTLYTTAAVNITIMTAKDEPTTRRMNLPYLESSFMPNIVVNQLAILALYMVVNKRGYLKAQKRISPVNLSIYRTLLRRERDFIPLYHLL